MNTNDLNTALYEKMAAEQDKYRDWLKSQPPAEVLNHAYEYTVREDIVMAMEELELTDAQAQALLDSPTPLADVYRHFEKLETGYMDVIRDSIENRADDACKAQAELRKAAIYPHSAAYAKEHGELEQYRASNNANIGKGRTESRAISAIIDYVAIPQKTDHGKLITGYECDSRVADAEFMLAKRQYIAATGRVRGADDVIAYHVRQSFCPGEITPEEANRLGVEFAKRFTKGKHAFIVCTHIDKAHVHNHIIWSSVNLDCDRKFRNFWGSTKAVRRLSDTICIENGLSIVENPKPHGKSYNKWLGDQAEPSHRELLRVAIDKALAQKPADLDELLKLLRESGCEVSGRGKSYRLKLPGWSKVARLDSLGDGYTLEDLLAVLAGQKEHTPRQKPVKQADPSKVNLLVDIQAKLQAGKGAGYVRWAKVFNLKQMAQTVNYLTEHNLLEYAVLEEKAAAATAHHNELSSKIKAAEKRMAEIAVLRTHIINYAKTRDTYVAYRKAGYSKKFREEHEEELLLHQAAKKAFDDMGVKKLPKVKELQAEYARLLEKKKKTYAEYRRSREEMRELLAAKANVDRLLNMEAEHDAEKEKDRDQR